MSTQAATIVTFYSYKGGVGRSMAVANVAWVLAKKFHKRVLVVDWDLEAPGLHRFFDIRDSDVTRGLIELFNDYKALLREEQKKLPEKLVEVNRYIQSTKVFPGGGEISILAAGKQDNNYATLINEFSWTDFYAKWHGFGFIEYLKNELKKLPNVDVVIVDSRTGVTDIGGICTLQLPDVVVLLFALNDQNIRGVKLVAERISEKAVEIEGRDLPPALIIRPSRVERTGNQAEKIKWQEIAASVLGEYVADADPQVLMAKRNIPYIGDYSYGETPLAVDKDPLGDMSDAFEDLAESILRTAGGEISFAPTKSFPSRRYFSHTIRRFLRNGKNLLILMLALVTVGLLVTTFFQYQQVENLSANLWLTTRENDRNVAELQKLKEIQTPGLPESTSVESDPQSAPASWETTRPDQAWCYQVYQAAPGVVDYKAVCHWSQKRCEVARSLMRVTATSNCEFVQGLRGFDWNPSYDRLEQFWYEYENQPLGPPFPQVPTRPSIR